DEGVDALVVELPRDETARNDALQLGGEEHEVVDDRVVERLDPEAVTRDHGAPLALVPHGGDELAAQVLAVALALTLVEVREHLGVAARAEGVAVCPQAVAERVVVVELAVLHGPHGPVLVGERLVAAGDVDDAQAPRAERDPRSLVRAAVVRPAM